MLVIKLELACRNTLVYAFVYNIWGGVVVLLKVHRNLIQIMFVPLKTMYLY